MTNLSNDIQLILSFVGEEYVLDKTEKRCYAAPDCSNLKSLISYLHVIWKNHLPLSSFSTKNDYHQAIKSVRPILQRLSCMTIDFCEVKIYDELLLLWFHETSKKVVSMVLASLCEADDLSTVHVLLLLTALLEHSFGNVSLLSLDIYILYLLISNQLALAEFL